MSLVHLSDIPIKDEPMDDDVLSTSSSGLEGEIDGLNLLINKDIRPFTRQLESRVEKVESHLSVVQTMVRESSKDIKELTKTLNTVRLELNSINAGARTPWVRRDEDGKCNSFQFDSNHQSLLLKDCRLQSSMSSKLRSSNTETLCSRQALCCTHISRSSKSTTLR